MKRIKESGRIFCDLQDAARYLYQLDPHRPARFLEAVYATFDFLARWSEVGRPRPGFGVEGLRSWRVKGFPSFVVFYVIRSDDLLIYRILHGARDLSQELPPQ